MRGLCLCAYVCLLTCGLFAQNRSSAESESSAPGLNPTRSRETHSEADGLTTDKQSVERLGMDGRYVPYLDVEKESVQVNPTTVRTTQRVYGRDADGRKVLTQVVEETKSSQAGGAEKVVRNTSNPDADGRLQLVQRETADTKRLSDKVQVTKTTAYTPGSDGKMVPSLQTEERRSQLDEHAVQVHKSTLLPDINGKWQVQEVRDAVVKDDAQQTIHDERVSRPDNDGRLAESERTVTTETKSESGEGTKTVESYATSTAGSADQGALRLNQRVTTASRKTLQGGTLTETKVSSRNPGAPNDELRTTQKTIDIVRPTTSGGTEHQQQTISIDNNGSSSVVSVNIGKASNTGKVELPKAAGRSEAKPEPKTQEKPQ
jgi:hypothetical protein